MDELEKMKQEAIEKGYDIPEEPSGKDATPDVAEVEVINYGDGK